MFVKKKHSILLVYSIIFVINLHINNIFAANAQCRSTADPNIVTFDGLYYQFHQQGDHFILYDDFKDTRVTVGYKQCGASATCNCAVYLKKGRKVVFVDFCTASDSSSPTSQFFGVSAGDKQTFGSCSVIKKMPRCQIILVHQENDEKTWNNVTTFLDDFKCVRLQGSNYYDTYVLRTVENHFEDTVKVRVQLSNRNMPDLYVQASKSSFKNTGGLCGYWDGNKKNELFVLDRNGVEKYVNSLTINNLQTLGEFWKLDSRYNKDSIKKRCPECYLMSERSFYCPCDEFDLFDLNNYNIQKPNRTTYCKVPMSQCVEKCYNQITNNEDTISPPVTLEPSVTLPPISLDEAIQICTEIIMSHIALGPVINAGIFNASLTIEICANDIINSGNSSVVNLHVQMTIDQIIQIILTNPENFIDDPLFDQILTGLCPNQCYGQGFCVIASECINNTSEECLSPIKCRCKEPYGGPDCSIDLTEIPELSLDRDCCDLRNEKCNEINGFGFPYSTRDKIYVKVELIEYLSDQSRRQILDYYSTNALADNNLLIKLNKLNKLQLYQNIHKPNSTNNIVLNSSQAFVNVYISYTNSSYNQSSSFVLYDSKCRSCVNNHQTLLNQNSCEIDGICYNDKETLASDVQFVCDSQQNNSSWSYKPTPDPLCSGDFAWTEWFNFDTPDGDGDLELLALFNAGCGDQSKLNQVEIANSSLSLLEANQTVHLNTQCFGFICLNKEQKDNQTCLDYKIRQCCPISQTTSHIHNTNTSTTSNEISTNTTQEEFHQTQLITNDDDQETETISQVVLTTIESNESSTLNELNTQNDLEFSTPSLNLEETSISFEDFTNESFTDEINTNLSETTSQLTTVLSEISEDTTSLSEITFEDNSEFSTSIDSVQTSVLETSTQEPSITQTISGLNQESTQTTIDYLTEVFTNNNEDVIQLSTNFDGQDITTTDQFQEHETSVQEVSFAQTTPIESFYTSNDILTNTIQEEFHQTQLITNDDDQETETISHGVLTTIESNESSTLTNIQQQTTQQNFQEETTGEFVNNLTTGAAIPEVTTQQNNANDSTYNNDNIEVTATTLNGGIFTENSDNLEVTSDDILDSFSTLEPLFETVHGLTNYWPFSGNFKDPIGHANLCNCTNSSLTKDRHGRSASALRLRNGYCRIPAGNYLNESFTVMAWAKPHTVDSSIGKSILTFGDDDKFDLMLFLLQYGDSVKQRRPALQIFSSANYYSFISNTSLSLGMWHHITGVHKDGFSYIYINGTLTDKAKTFTPRQIIRNKNYVGRQPDNPHGPYIDADLDEIKIFNRDLDELEILKEMNGASNFENSLETTTSSQLLHETTAEHIPLNSGLIHYWNFDKNVRDKITGNSMTNCVNSSYISDRYGNDYSALDFHDGYCQVSSDTFFDGDFTIMVFAKAYSKSNGKAVLDFGVNQNNELSDEIYFLLHFADSTKPQRPALQIFNDKEVIYFVSKKSLSLNEWHHITVVHNQGISYIYVNGTLADRARTLSPRGVFRNFNFVGRHNEAADGPYFDGALDELKIFNRALENEEILREMIDGKSQKHI